MYGDGSCPMHARRPKHQDPESARLPRISALHVSDPLSILQRPILKTLPSGPPQHPYAFLLREPPATACRFVPAASPAGFPLADGSWRTLGQAGHAADWISIAEWGR